MTVSVEVLLLTNAEQMVCTKAELGHDFLRLLIIGWCLRVFIAVKRHQDQGNSYKGKFLIGAGLQVKDFQSLLSRWEHGEGAESSTSSSEGCQEKVTILKQAGASSQNPPR
jgi:hypothetical protein